MAFSRFSMRRPHTPAASAPRKPEPLIALPATAKSAPARLAQTAETIDLHQRLLDSKLSIHRRLIDEINLASVDKIPEKELRPQIHDLVAQHVANERIALNAQELAKFVDDILHEMTGLGPIEPLLKDETINDILINTHAQIYIERFGRLELSNARFKDEAHLLRIINKIVSTVGRRVDESQPMCDARLLDGSRVNVAIKPVAVDGPLVSIRKFSKKPLSMERLVETTSISREMAALLADRRGRAGDHDGLRRHRLRQDDDAERPFVFHFR